MQTAGDALHQSATRRQIEALSQTLLYHAFELPDGTALPGLIPVENLRRRLDAFAIPADLTGLRVLDIGAASGWNSFELARRGAEVVAVDYVRYPEFSELAPLFGGQIQYEILDMEEMTPARLGTFDIVLFFGVLYHLRHPLLGLERVCSLTRGYACIESFVIDADLPPAAANDRPALLEFYETTELGGQLDNWFGPNQRALAGLCRSAGFVRVTPAYIDDRRAGLLAHRLWPAPPADPAAAAPELRAVINNRDSTPRFSPPRDEYLCAYFESAERDLAPASVFAEIDGFALPVLAVAALEGTGWQANFRCPSWLAPGPHAFRLRTARSPRSNAVPIYCHMDPPAVSAGPIADAAVEILEIGNGVRQEPIFHGYRVEYLCCRFRLAAAALGPADLTLTVGREAVPVTAVVALGPGIWQANAAFPAALGEGLYDVCLAAAGSPPSRPFPIARAAG